MTTPTASSLSRRLSALVARGAAVPYLRLTRTRLLFADLDRMGDTCQQLDQHVKAQLLGWQPRARTIVLGRPGRRIGNPHLMRYWRRYVRVVSSPLVYSVLFRAAPHAPDRVDDGHLVVWPGRPRVESIEAVIAVQRQWELEGRPQLLSLTAADRRRGWDLLESLGVEREAWFACLHVREPGWLGESEQSEHRHSNADVETYLPAVRLITERGGWVIRMGDRSMKALPPMERVLDYAHDPGRTDWMDVFLAAECRFFLGSTSGLFGLAYLFGRPCVLANWCPMSDRPWASRDLFIPKLHRPLGGGPPLPFAVGFAPSLKHASHISELIHAGIEVIDSEPAEIVDLVREALDRDSVPDFYDERDLALRRRYDSLATFFQSGVTSRPGRDFLRKYEELLPPEP